MTPPTMQHRYTALVTGATSGIGLELSRVLAANGHPLAIVARDVDRLETVAAELRSGYGVPLTCFAKDLAKSGAAEDLWADLSNAGIAVDALVNNAGVGVYGEFPEQSLDAIRRMQMINIVAPTTLTRLAIPWMLAHERGRILNVASTVAYQPGGPRMAVYYATKSYVLSFSKGIASELKGSGVSVTVLCPGPTVSSFEQRSGAQDTRLYRFFPQMTPSTVALAGELPPRTLALAVNRFLLTRV